MIPTTKAANELRGTFDAAPVNAGDEAEAVPDGVVLEDTGAMRDPVAPDDEPVALANPVDPIFVDALRIILVQGSLQGISNHCT